MIWRWSGDPSGSWNPSTSEMSGVGRSSPSASARSLRFVRCRPSRSIRRALADWTTTCSASARITLERASRAARLRRFESSRPPRASRSRRDIESKSKTTAATTIGPASAPLPASSTPATRETPSRRSNANSAREGRAREGATAASPEYGPSCRACHEGSRALPGGRRPPSRVRSARPLANVREMCARPRRRSSACVR